MNIRLASPKDAKQIAQVHVVSWKEAYKNIMTEKTLSSITVAKQKKEWDTYLEDEHAQTLVAEKDGRIVGFVIFGDTWDEDLEDKSDSSYEIYSIYVDPAEFGNGIGTELLTEMKKHEKRNHIYVWVVVENKWGQFFLKHGFKQQKKTLKDFNFKGELFPIIRYKK
ncbi:MAG TPA: GNAT family N-acetyltransferase [Thermodesulfobacteriota bacterium]|nr:GNAT family N-acetyltransferase [Thermodesulfobacteriota bacterium]